MPDTKNILQPLLEIGLSKYESKVYLTLISEGVSAAKNISDITGIPYGKVYEIINSLSYKGFAMILPTKPMKYRAISPYQAIQTAKKNTEERYKKIERHFLELHQQFRKNKQFIGSKTAFNIIIGRSNVVNKIEEMIKKAKNNINIYCTANTLSRLVLHKEALKEAANKGIKISIAGITNKENLQEIRSLNFCDIRHVQETNNNLFSVDGNESMIIEPTPDDDNIIYGRDFGIIASSDSFTRFLDNFFVSNFNKARQIDLK
jgi:sugar-specific transcriptional regulator TrmB